jgi:hypothetical protein
MQAVLRRSRGLVMAAVAAGVLALGAAQPAHANNPVPPCGAWFHKWQYWTEIWQSEAMRLNADSVSDLEWYAVGQANDYMDLLVNYNCNVF